MATLAPGVSDQLGELAELLDRHRWAAELLDERWRVVWVSEELQTLYGETRPEVLGLGDHILAARVRGMTVTAADRESWLQTNVPLMIESTEGGIEAIEGMLAPELTAVLDGIEPRSPPPRWASGFEFVRGDFRGRVNYLGERLQDERGALVGFLYLYEPDLPASVLTLMVRGDRAMYERMAELVEPGTRAAGILFADLEASGALSRKLPSAAYFSLIRALRSRLEAKVAESGGILGKHAGDGVTAFFLAEQLDSDSAAARAALDAARFLPRLTEETAAEQRAAGLPVPSSPKLNVGVHWGATLYVGQVAAEGRLEVTALGDEVNEASRIEQASRGGRVLASKPLLERLDERDALHLGVDPARLTYEVVGELEGASDKAVRDAGLLAVADVAISSDPREAHEGARPPRT